MVKRNKGGSKWGICLLLIGFVVVFQSTVYPWGVADAIKKQAEAIKIAIARAVHDQASVLKVLKPGTIIAIKSHKNGRYLKMHGKYVKATGTSQNDKACQFGIHRGGNLLGFTHAGKKLQSVATWTNDRHTVRLENNNWGSWEQWELKGNLSTCYFRNRATGGYMSVRGGDIVTTHDHRWQNRHVGWGTKTVRYWRFWGWRSHNVRFPKYARFRHPAGPHSWERFRIDIVKTAEQAALEAAQKKRDTEQNSGLSGLAALEAAYAKKKKTEEAKALAEKLEKMRELKRQKELLEKERKGITPKAEETAALKKLKHGALVAIKSVGENDTGKYLQVQGGRFLASTGESKDDPDAHFVVLRKDNWVGFKSYRAGSSNLLANPDNHAVAFASKNFGKWEQWALVPEEPDSLDAVWLHNNISGGFLSIPDQDWDGDRVWTRKDSEGRAAVKDETGKFAIEVIDDVDDRMKPGGDEYIHAPELTKEPVAADAKWKFAQEGKGWITFKVKALESVSVFISKEPTFNKEQHIGIVIGANGNSGSVIVKNGKPQVTLNSAKLAHGLPGDGAQEEEIWVAWSGKKGTLSAGRGSIVGEQSFASWRDPEVGDMATASFVCLGNHGEVRSSFTNITLSPPPPPVPDVVPPAGFEKLPGKLDRVAIGARKGKVVAWGITDEGNLTQWDGEEWQDHDAKDQDDADIEKFEHLAFAADGTLMATTSDGDVYQYIWEDQETVLLPVPGLGVKTPEKAITPPSNDEATKKALEKEQKKRKKRKKKKLKRRVKKLTKRIAKFERKLKTAQKKKNKKKQRKFKRKLKKLRKRLKRTKNRLAGKKRRKGKRGNAKKQKKKNKNKKKNKKKKLKKKKKKDKKRKDKKKKSHKGKKQKKNKAGKQADKEKDEKVGSAEEENKEE